MSRRPEDIGPWDMPETFYVWVEGEQYGPFSLSKLGEMRVEGRLPQTTLYWSEHYKEWRSITLILNDHYPSADRVRNMREAGITYCKILGAGHGDECPACLEQIERVMPLDEFAGTPPPGCTCIPWCRCVVIAVKKIKIMC